MHLVCSSRTHLIHLSQSLSASFRFSLSVPMVCFLSLWLYRMERECNFGALLKLKQITKWYQSSEWMRQMREKTATASLTHTNDTRFILRIRFDALAWYSSPPVVYTLSLLQLRRCDQKTWHFLVSSRSTNFSIWSVWNVDFEPIDWSHLGCDALLCVIAVNSFRFSSLHFGVKLNFVKRKKKLYTNACQTNVSRNAELKWNH